MRALYRTAISLIILSTMMFTPNLVWGSSLTTDSTNHYGMSAILAQTVASAKPNEVLSVVAEFPEGSTPDYMTACILELGLNTVTIRHAFHLIPMVSLYIESNEVNKLAKSLKIVGLTLDVTKTLADEEAVGEYTVASNEEGYIHFTETIDAEGLWSQGINGSGVVVAVLDSGADGEHPDLQNKIIKFKDYINNHDDLNPSDGMDAYDDDGHGTACAWNIAGDGTANGGEFTGVAPGANLLIVKVLNQEGSGDDSVIAEGIEYAVDNGADIISLSLGGEWTDDTYQVEASVVATRAAVEAGVSVVIAAGNSGPQAYSINSPGIVEEAVTVGASIDGKGVVSFSSVGPVYRTTSEPSGYSAKPDIVAPGYQVVSGRAQDANADEYLLYNSSQYSDEYTQWSGTSAATPIVAGALALLAQNFTLLTPDEAKVSIMKSAQDLDLDPMIQGWGVLNVTAAAEVLSESSRDITIMTPRRFPTLPWSGNVLIIGDDRPPQNVTIISTHAIGSSSIEITGNASTFVRTNSEIISVIAGYSYFGIWLEIPEDLAITDVGQYLGQLKIVHENITIASIDINFAITLFGGRLMVDMEHHSTDDPDYPSYYGYFTEYLRGEGVVLSEFGSPSDTLRSYIDLSSLAGSDIFIIMDTETAYTDGEISALHQFVDMGGTLLVFSEFWDSSSNQASFGIDYYNQILEPFGIQCERRGIGVGLNGYGEVYDANTGSVAENDSLMTGVNSLYIVQGSTLSVDTSIARGLFWEDAEKTHAIVATSDYGKGHVIVISDGSTLYDEILYDAIRFGADNLRLLRNLAASIIPEAPRIYDVILEHGDFGEIANVTAYIFDDDLDVVSMNIISPSGANITGVVTESLGYKYSTSFVFNSGGFYTFTVIARDSSGNEKIFQKIVLISVNAVDDFFVQAVTYSLLGIVGAGLIYTGYQKYFTGRKPKQKTIPSNEDEWEVPPPSIE